MSQFDSDRLSTVLEGDGQWVRGPGARRVTLSAALAVTELVETTLGPRGFDKLLVAADGTIVDATDVTDSDAILCTNDGMTILEQANVAHPAARTLVEVAQAQHASVADGTTTAVVLAGALLREAADLLERGTHPVEVIRGYRRAAERAEAVVDDVGRTDDRLESVAATCLAGTVLDGDRARVAELVARAVRRVSDPGESGRPDGEDWRTRVVSPERGPGWSPRIARASVLDRTPVDDGMPTAVEGSLLLVEAPLATTDTEAVLEKRASGWSGYEDLVDRDAENARARTETVRRLDPDVILCGEIVDDQTAARLAREGILAFECVPDDELARLGELLGARPAATLDDAREADLAPGSVRYEPRLNGYWFEPDGGEPAVVTLVVPEPAVSETYHNVPKRIVEDALAVARRTYGEGRVVPGGGAIEAAIADRVRDRAAGIDGREQLAFEAFADAVETVPRRLAASAGMKPTDAVLELRTAHGGDDGRPCVDARDGALVDAFDAGIVDSAAVKRQSIQSAVEAVNRVLKIDAVIAAGDASADDAAES